MPREARHWAQGGERRHFAHVTDLWRTATPRVVKWPEPDADTLYIWQIASARFSCGSGLTNYLLAQVSKQQLLFAFSCPVASSSCAAPIHDSGASLSGS